MDAGKWAELEAATDEYLRRVDGEVEELCAHLRVCMGEEEEAARERAAAMKVLSPGQPAMTEEEEREIVEACVARSRGERGRVMGGEEGREGV